MVPELAPLFARMTTYVIGQRFTASEALAFFNEHMHQLPEWKLLTPVTTEGSFEPLNDSDYYWSLLSHEDRDKWSSHRVPPSSLWRRLLSYIAQSSIGWRIMSYVRGLLHI